MVLNIFPGAFGFFFQYIPVILLLLFYDFYKFLIKDIAYHFRVK